MTYPKSPLAAAMTFLVASLSNEMVSAQDTATSVATTEPSTATANCIPCIGDGSFDTSLSFAGNPCDVALAEFAAAAEGDEICILGRIAGTAFCGCASEVPLSTCSLCGSFGGEEMVDVSLPLPDIGPFLTCGDLLEIPAVDGDATCSLIQEKYAYFCGCPNAAPGCSLCSDDSSFVPNLDVPPFVEGEQVVGSCSLFEDLFQVQTKHTCPEIRESLKERLPIDIFTYCQCSNVEASGGCSTDGTKFCPEGTTVPDVGQDEQFDNEGADVTCRTAQILFETTTDQSLCASLSVVSSFCCVAPGEESISLLDFIGLVTNATDNNSSTTSETVVPEMENDEEATDLGDVYEESTGVVEEEAKVTTPPTTADVVEEDEEESSTTVVDIVEEQTTDVPTEPSAITERSTSEEQEKEDEVVSSAAWTGFGASWPMLAAGLVWIFFLLYQEG